MGYRTNAVAILAGGCVAAALSACSPSSQPVEPTPQTSAPISADSLVLSGANIKGSDSTLSGRLSNPSGDEVTVVGGSAFFASQVQVVKTTVSKGKKVVQEGPPLPIPAGGEVVLNPRGYQLRVLNLTQNLKAGQIVPINLTLATGATMTAKARVVATR